ncbi:hypothetical protein R3P38DRAFT_3264701 [Favolaschia claudopus]|uniref:F-box domain-containing protein n=1 Tax=Favolaschia claudopus TaxID=2862362 RepID=A0AAW0C0F7_9AGAR
MSVYREPALSDSPFHEHLHTNYIPTDAGIGQIRGHLMPHEEELARLDALIRDLSTKRGRIKGYIDAHKALVSHPRRLPPELLQKIFVQCLPTTHNAVMSVAAAPLLLGHICSRWRAVAFSTSRLWDSLHVSVKYVGWNSDKSAAIIDWLTRAGSRPLSLSISCEKGDYPESAHCESLLPLLFTFSARWSSLRCTKVPVKHLLQLEEGIEAPLLEDIHVTCQSPTPYSGPGSHILDSPLFNGTRVSITTLDPAALIEERLQGVGHRWDHLTDLALDRLGPRSPSPDFEDEYTYRYLDYNAVYRLLQRCTNLRSLKVPVEVGDDLTDETLDVPLLESLTLVVAGSSCDALGELIEHLVMPQLTKFHLINLDSADYPPPPSNLKLHRPHEDIVAILHTVLADFSPHLQKFSLGHPYVSTFLNADELFRNLSPGSVTIPGLDLTELSLDLEYVPDALWSQFLWEHINHHTRLRKFHLQLWSPHRRDVPPPAAPDIDPFLTRGLDVAVTHHIRPPWQMSPWQGIENR